VLVEEEDDAPPTPIKENNSSVVMSPTNISLNREEIAYHIKNIQKQFHLVKSQVDIIEV
jgi:hypothetical protein